MCTKPRECGRSEVHTHSDATDSLPGKHVMFVLLSKSQQNLMQEGVRLACVLHPQHSACDCVDHACSLEADRTEAGIAPANIPWRPQNLLLLPDPAVWVAAQTPSSAACKGPASP